MRVDNDEYSALLLILPVELCRWLQTIVRTMLVARRRANGSVDAAVDLGKFAKSQSNKRRKRDDH